MAGTLGAFYEFFAGAGMARAGLGDRWRYLFANDFDQKKAATYRLNWGRDNFVCGDVREVTTSDLPQIADLVWASFPCQDLSLAGGGAGLKGERSGTFWPFWDLMTELVADGREPSMIVLENVCGTLTSHSGTDFTAICQSLSKGGYRFGALIVDAVLFVAQSRPRLFIIALRREVDIPETLTGDGPDGDFHPRRLRTAYRKLPKALQEDWILVETRSAAAARHRVRRPGGGRAKRGRVAHARGNACPVGHDERPESQEGPRRRTGRPPSGRHDLQAHASG